MRLSLAVGMMIAFSALMGYHQSTVAQDFQRTNEFEQADPPKPTRMVKPDDPYSCRDYAWNCGPLE